MQRISRPAIAANRFGLGARPGELDAIGGDARDWLRAQLHGARAAARTAVQLRVLARDILAQALELRREIGSERASAPAPTRRRPPRDESCRSSCGPSTSSEVDRAASRRR